MAWKSFRQLTGRCHGRPTAGLVLKYSCAGTLKQLQLCPSEPPGNLRRYGCVNLREEELL
jgi:hypothetical protein